MVCRHSIKVKYVSEDFKDYKDKKLGNAALSIASLKHTVMREDALYENSSTLTEKSSKV